MKNTLVINSSADTQGSVSRILVDEIVRHFEIGRQTIVHRDVGRDPVPHLTPQSLAGVRGEAMTMVEKSARQLSDKLIAELRAADTIVIGAPMYNFSIPTTLRSWFDYVLRAGETFSYSEAGPRGLITGKRAIVVISRGGQYSEGPGKAIDFQEPYLRHLLGFIGISDVTVIYAEKIGYGADARASAIERAVGEIRALSKEPLAA